MNLLDEKRKEMVDELRDIDHQPETSQRVNELLVLLESMDEDAEEREVVLSELKQEQLK